MLLVHENDKYPFCTTGWSDTRNNDICWETANGLDEFSVVSRYGVHRAWISVKADTMYTWEMIHAFGNFVSGQSLHNTKVHNSTKWRHDFNRAGSVICLFKRPCPGGHPFHGSNLLRLNLSVSPRQLLMDRCLLRHWVAQRPESGQPTTVAPPTSSGTEVWHKRSFV